MKTLAAFLALALTGCVTRATIHAKHVTVTVSPTVRLQGLPLSLP